MADISKDRTILHCDCNGFYASVECVLNPKLKEVPMAVGGDRESRHGIILAKNEKAKKYNIQTAETIYKALGKCPQLVIVPPHHSVYREFSVRINEIYKRYTDLVEPFSIDESWLDVTSSRRLFGTGREIADRLRSEVKNETGVTISVGVSFNKVFAKLGSDYKKPDATTVISRENWRDILFPLPVSDMLYVGGATERQLKSLNIHTIGDLAYAGDALLTSRLGKLGHTLYIYANGLDDEPVRSVYETREVKSVGNGETFREDISGEEEIRRAVFSLSDSIAVRMRKHNLKCTTVQVQIKSPQFKVISRQRKLNAPTYSARDIGTAAMDIMRSSWGFDNPIRMITVTGSGLVRADAVTEQLSFFDDNVPKKHETLEKTMDGLRKKFGTNKIDFGYNMEE